MSKINPLWGSSRSRIPCCFSTFQSLSCRIFISDCFIYEEDATFDNLSYETFFEYIEEYCRVPEEDYNQALAQILPLNIKSYNEFLDQSETGFSKEYVWDPVAKAYIHGVKPEMKTNTAYDMNDTIREYLQSKGLPCDDEAINSLSLDDVYAIVAGTYGTTVAEAAEPEAETEEAAEEAAAEEAAAEDSPAGDVPAENENRIKAWLVWLIAAIAAGVAAALYLLCPPVKAAADSLIAAVAGLFQ